MKGHLIAVKLQKENEFTNFYNMIAKIIEKKEKTYKIKYLCETKKKHNMCNIFKFDKEVSEIEKECVDEFFETTDVEQVGFEQIEGVGYILGEIDCWQPSSESEEES